MSNANPPQPRKRRWTPWKIFFLAVGLLVVLAVLLVTFAGMRFSVLAKARIEAQLAAIREAGEPATPAELEEYYRLPPDVEDTTALWLEAAAMLDTPAFAADASDLPIVGRDSEIPPPGEPWEDLEAVEELLAKYRASLALMHQAAEAGGAARYPTDFRQHMLMSTDHVQRLRGAARLLSLEAHVRAHRGDAAGAAKSIRAILMLARSLEREPVTVSMLVRIACESIAIGLLEEQLTAVDFSDEQLIELQQDLRAADYMDNVYQGLLGERVAMVAAVENLGAEGGGVRGGLWRWTQQDGIALTLEHMGALIEATKEPMPQAMQAADQADQRMEQITNSSSLNRIRYMVPSLLLPALGGVFRAAARVQAVNDLADTAIAVERCRRRHGKLPEKLDDLVPEFLPQVPVDPFDGQPLRYVLDEEGCRIYSLGTNQTDQGGEGDLDGEPDIVFRVRPPHRAGEAPEE